MGLKGKSRMKNKFISKIYESGFVEDSQGKKIFVLKSGIPYDEGMAIHELIRRTRSERTLEVGMAYGLSGLFACQAHVENNIGGVHTAIDPEQCNVFDSIGIINIERAGLEQHFRFFEACSYEALPQLLKQGERFDFIFIDGMHVFDFTLVDFFYADLLLKPGGYLMFDDLWMPSVRKVFLYVLRNRRYKLDMQWIWESKSILRRFLHFIRKDTARRIKIKLTLQHQLRNPFDWSAIWLAWKGCLKYQVLQKMGEDDRSWSYHKEF
jgi:predicted O-methyltransferase YrrM